MLPNLRYKNLLDGSVATSKRIRIGVQKLTVGIYPLKTPDLITVTV